MRNASGQIGNGVSGSGMTQLTPFTLPTAPLSMCERAPPRASVPADGDHQTANVLLGVPVVDALTFHIWLL